MGKKQCKRFSGLSVKFGTYVALFRLNMSNIRDEHESIAERLRRELADAEKRYKSREIDPSEYLRLLEQFNDFVLRGKMP